MISLLVALLFLPLVVTAGKKPDKPGRPSGSVLSLSGDVISIGQLNSRNAPRSRRIEADGTLDFVSEEDFKDLPSEHQSDPLDFTGPHDGHLTIKLSPRRDTAYFSFVYSDFIDEDPNVDHILLHNPTGFAGVREVEIIGKNYMKVTLAGKFELWVAYKDEEGNYLHGEAWFPYLSIDIIVEIDEA